MLDFDQHSKSLATVHKLSAEILAAAEEGETRHLMPAVVNKMREFCIFRMVSRVFSGDALTRSRACTENKAFRYVDENTASASYYFSLKNQFPLDFVADQVMLLDFLRTYTRTSNGWRFLERDARPLLVPRDICSKVLAVAADGASH
ncbi:MAG: hypothetical protein A2496_23080 [Burkholderiales bacterium RIFOXYC12_FULL_60_6]|nr:MAG: hypothetical protein A2503_01690 [Burkholderiales bacterium RIFOXYD12_FULL_59_19]OGB79020.1 MAG: hypothetical protein A2496_23080 [Burkholderiales bacterium RIFOXYC12_FULL_60_6]